MKIAFRVDASETVGFGHLSRCINLAEELRNRGCDILFVTREDALKSHKVLENRLFETVLLPAPEIPGTPHENLSSLLLRSEIDDADETIKALDGFKPHGWSSTVMTWARVSRPNFDLILKRSQLSTIY